MFASLGLYSIWRGLFTIKTVREHRNFISPHKDFLIHILSFPIFHPLFVILIFSFSFFHSHFTIRVLSSAFFCVMNETDPLYSSIVNCVFNAFSAYTAIMLNILTIHAMGKTSSLPKPLKTLLLSLAVCVGLLAQPSLYVYVVSLDCYLPGHCALIPRLIISAL